MSPHEHAHPRTDFVLAVRAPVYRVTDRSFATESAFAEHLRELRISLAPRFTRVVLIAPLMSELDHAGRHGQLGIVSQDDDGVALVVGHGPGLSTARFWLEHARPAWRRIKLALEHAGVVQSGIEDDLGRPLMGMVNVAAWLTKRPLVFVVDIDFRNNARRYRALGMSRLRRYLYHRLFYEPVLWLQVWIASRLSPLVMLKSASMVHDFGRGRPQVKNFYDTVHSSEQVLALDKQSVHLARLRAGTKPLRLVYFGRLVAYKGLDRMVDAVRLARERGADVRLSLIGSGDQLASLQARVAEAELADHVHFLAPVPYGPELFGLLQDFDLTLATPLTEDTPRAAFDSMARGLPIAAFDIGYFRDLARESGAVALARWPEPGSLADTLVGLAHDRNRLAELAANGLRFAAHNTQQIWLQRRRQWVLEVAR